MEWDEDGSDALVRVVELLLLAQEIRKREIGLRMESSRTRPFSGAKLGWLCVRVCGVWSWAGIVPGEMSLY